ncbi:MAG: tryptophan--tRNA ligase [Candidatus Nanoarchaeia archaeon]|jgi:tryptophanyl-tRNA synthetase|nr:tryptophan--tRNA ligase [Candidatus Nanoarchaeia archaeon]|tara:strand:+ start:20279 stop:21364 length:1086 start_codon:yes stop_codon:yes gene_type:complete
MGNIDPWGSKEVVIDENLIKKFGLTKFSDSDRKKFNHYLFKRKIILAHRDFNKISDCLSGKKQFIQLTGIASSGLLHLGHKVDIDIFLYFKKLGAKSYFVVSDIDAYLSRPDSKIPSLEKAKEFAINNIAHLLALGLNKKDIYLQSKKEPRYYEFAFEISKKITENTFRAIYGHLDLGKLSANLLQYADILHPQLKEFNKPMPSITGIGIEQDPHARACRDIARRLPYKLQLPSFIYFSHQSALQLGKKMSASEPDSAIFLDDNKEDIKRKINKAYSGGRESLKEHKKLGGIPENDKAFEILLYHHPNSNFIQKVHDQYKNGKLSTGELKSICKEFLIEMLSKHQRKLKRTEKIAEKIVLI